MSERKNTILVFLTDLCDYFVLNNVLFPLSSATGYSVEAVPPPEGALDISDMLEQPFAVFTDNLNKEDRSALDASKQWQEAEKSFSITLAEFYVLSTVVDPATRIGMFVYRALFGDWPAVFKFMLKSLAQITSAKMAEGSEVYTVIKNGDLERLRKKHNLKNDFTNLTLNNGRYKVKGEENKLEDDNSSSDSFFNDGDFPGAEFLK